MQDDGNLTPLGPKSERRHDAGICSGLRVGMTTPTGSENQLLDEAEGA